MKGVLPSPPSVATTTATSSHPRKPKESTKQVLKHTGTAKATTCKATTHFFLTYKCGTVHAFQTKTTACIDRSSHHIGLVMLSAYSSIYSKAEDYKTECTVALNTEQKLMPAASLSSLSQCQVLQLRTALTDYNLKMMPLFDQLLIANLLNCKCPYCGTSLCVTHVHILLVCYDTTKVAPYIQKRLIYGFFSLLSQISDVACGTEIVVHSFVVREVNTLPPPSLSPSRP